ARRHPPPRRGPRGRPPRRPGDVACLFPTSSGPVSARRWLYTGIRVIVTHDFFETFGGAERVTAEIARAFPDAPVYGILGRRAVAERMGIADRVVTLLPEREA